MIIPGFNIPFVSAIETLDKQNSRWMDDIMRYGSLIGTPRGITIDAYIVLGFSCKLFILLCCVTFNPVHISLFRPEIVYLVLFTNIK